jgi:membrane protease YdiL (CAAX protease family)
MDPLAHIARRSRHRVTSRTSQRSLRGLRLWIITWAGILFVSSLVISMTAPLRSGRVRAVGRDAGDDVTRRTGRAPYVAPVAASQVAQIESGRRLEGLQGLVRWKRNSIVRPDIGAVDGSAWLTFGSAVAIAAAELLTTTTPLVGMVLHVVVVFALIFVAATTTSDASRRFALALVLAPMTRIVSLGIPTAHLSPSVAYVVVAVPLFLSSLAAIRALGLAPAEINLRVPALRAVLPSIVVMLSGIVIGLVEYVLLRPEAMSTVATPEHLMLTVVMLLVPAAFLEEFIFRGILQTGARGVMARGPAIVYAACIFGVLHLGQAPPFHVVFVALAGAVFGWFVVWTNSLYPVVVAHSLANVMLFIVLPLHFG